jgi:predicted TIM-barrel fold metal-dependent hydrolase
MLLGTMPTLDHPHKRPNQPLPADAADCHMHVFGPLDRFPLAPERSYNVPEAPLAEHEAMKGAVGLARTVLVQPSGYGTDNRAMLAALQELGPCGRGVAVVDLDAPDAELETMHAAGVRAVRLNLVSLRSRYSHPAQLIGEFASRLKPRGWHLQVFGENHLIAALEPALAQASVDVVVDHMGLPDARHGLDQPGFKALLRLLKTGRVWAKLAGADRVTRFTGRLSDAVPFMQALAAANPDRLVWGSDWPNIGFHTGMAVGHDTVLPYRELDAGALLDVLAEAVPEAALRQKILADNPARLYQFS